MPNKQFMLTRQQKKPCTHLGIEVIPKPGNQPDVMMQRYVPFIPGKISDVDVNVDMSAAVDAGFIVEVNTDKFREIKEEALVAPKSEDPVDEPEMDVDDEPKGDDKPITVDVGAMTAEIDPGEDGELGTEDDEVTISPNGNGDFDYEETDDGRFECLVCKREGEEKILKTEKGIIDHIEDKHR